MPQWQVHDESGPPPAEPCRATCQDCREGRGVDVAARHDAEDLAASGTAGDGCGDRRRARALGDNVSALHQQAHRDGDLVEHRDERAREQLARQSEHLGEDPRPADSSTKLRTCSMLVALPVSPPWPKGHPE